MRIGDYITILKKAIGGYTTREVLLGKLCEIAFVDKETREAIKGPKPGVLPPVAMNVDGVRYDSARATALCHTEMINGWMMELYRGNNGKYFVVHWSDWENAKPFITPCEAKNARRLYEDHREEDDALSDDVFK